MAYSACTIMLSSAVVSDHRPQDRYGSAAAFWIEYYLACMLSALLQISSARIVLSFVFTEFQVSGSVALPIGHYSLALHILLCLASLASNTKHTMYTVRG